MRNGINEVEVIFILTLLSSSFFEGRCFFRCFGYFFWIFTSQFVLCTVVFAAATEYN